MSKGNISKSHTLKNLLGVRSKECLHTQVYICWFFSKKFLSLVQDEPDTQKCNLKHHCSETVLFLAALQSHIVD